MHLKLVRASAISDIKSKIKNVVLFTMLAPVIDAITAIIKVKTSA